MKVEFSKAFIKASKRLSGKMLDSLKRTIVEVKAAKGIQDISKLQRYSLFANNRRTESCVQYHPIRWNRLEESF